MRTPQASHTTPLISPAFCHLAPDATLWWITVDQVTEIAAKTQSDLSRILAERQSNHRVPGLVGAIAREGGLAWSDGVGSADLETPGVAPTPDTQYLIASHSKTFTAVAGSSGGYSIRIPAGSYVVIAGRADRSPHQRQITVQPGEHLTLNLTITPPTG